MLETSIETEASPVPPTTIDSQFQVEYPTSPVLENLERNPEQNSRSLSALIPTAKLRCTDPIASMQITQAPKLGRGLRIHNRAPRSQQNHKYWRIDTSMTTPQTHGTAKPVEVDYPARRFGTIKRKRSRRSSILHPPGTVSLLPCCSHKSYACGSLSCARSSIQTKARLYWYVNVIDASCLQTGREHLRATV